MTEVNVGLTANDGTGDPLRTAFIKINTDITALQEGLNAIEQLPDAQALLEARQSAEDAAETSITASTAASTAAFQAALYDGPKVDTFADLQSVTTTMLPVAETIRVIDSRDVYRRVASGGDLDYSGAGGVRLEVVPTNGIASCEQFGVSPSNTALVNDSGFLRAFAWLNAMPQRKLTLGAGIFDISVALPPLTRSQSSFEGAGRSVTTLRLPATSTNGTFLQISTAEAITARSSVSGLRLEHLNVAGTLSGYAIVFEGANDIDVEHIWFKDVAGLIDVGPTAKCSRIRMSDFRGNFQDSIQHRIGRFQRWTGMVYENVKVYGDQTEYRELPLYEFRTVGICDTLNWRDVTTWTRTGSRYGVLVNCDNGTFVNADFIDLIHDKTGKGGAAFWFEMTAASTASAVNFWKIQNINIIARSDHGGVGDVDKEGVPVGGNGGVSLYVSQGASTGYSAIRGITASLLSSVRDGAVVKTLHTGTDIAESIKFVNCRFRDASTEADAIEAVMEMGIDDFSVVNCDFHFAERPPVSLNIDYAIKITNPAIKRFNIVGNQVQNVTNGLIKHPTAYNELSHNRIEVGNTVIAGGANDLALPMLAPRSIFPALSGNVANAAANVAAINAALAESVSLGNRMVKVKGAGSIPVNDTIKLPTTGAFSWVNETGVKYVPIFVLPTGTRGFVEPNTLGTPARDAIIENLVIAPGANAADSGNPFSGVGAFLHLLRCRLNGFRVENYWGRQAALMGLYDTTISNFFARTDSTVAGTGAARMLAGENSQIEVDAVYCGDDGLQFVPSLSGTLSNQSIKNCRYIGGISSSNARPFLAFLDTGMTANITGCGFIGVAGISRQATLGSAGSVVVTSQGPGAVTGLQVTGCTIDETARTTFTAGAHGLRMEGNVTDCAIDLTILEPQQQALRILNNAASGLVPQRNLVQITTNKAPRDGNTSTITVVNGVRNTIIPRIFACSNEHSILLSGGDRTAIRDGHVLGIPTGFAGVRDNAATNTDISRFEFQGAVGAFSHSFAATPAATGRVFDCRLGGLAGQGTAPTLSNNL